MGRKPEAAAEEGKGRAGTTNSHLHRAIAPAADELVRDEIDAVHLVRVPGQVRFDFVRLEVPELSHRAGQRRDRDRRCRTNARNGKKAAGWRCIL